MRPIGINRISTFTFRILVLLDHTLAVGVVAALQVGPRLIGCSCEHCRALTPAIAGKFLKHILQFATVLRATQFPNIRVSEASKSRCLLFRSKASAANTTMRITERLVPGEICNRNGSSSSARRHSGDEKTVTARALRTTGTRRIIIKAEKHCSIVTCETGAKKECSRVAQLVGIGWAITRLGAYQRRRIGDLPNFVWAIDVTPKQTRSAEKIAMSQFHIAPA